MSGKAIKALRVLAVGATVTASEPIVVRGEVLANLLGTPIANLRMVNGDGIPIPFQVDEVTPDGEYVCDRGESPNGVEGNGYLDAHDEIVFLWEDASALGVAEAVRPTNTQNRITVYHGHEVRSVVVSADTAIPLSPTRYINYDSASETVRTPFYHAQFGRRRFHFIQAGIDRRNGSGLCRLTNELRIRIFFKAFHIVPIEFNEENLVCTVKRYKLGPLRLIRRGDFHLNLGMGLRGGRASVNQVCYPQAVGVPVSVHIPFRFGRFFGEAFIEMTPVIANHATDFAFAIPEKNLYVSFGTKDPLDSLFAIPPCDQLFLVHDGSDGFGWLLRVDIADSLLAGSGFIVQRPSTRGGAAHCGFRLTVRDLPRGNYLITNWVVFSDNGIAGFDAIAKKIADPARIWVNDREATTNALAQLRSRSIRGKR